MKLLEATGSLMGCSANQPPGAKKESNILLNDEDCGLKCGHAYALLHVFEIECDKCKL